MSLQIPELTIGTKQFFTNSDNEKFELRLHNNSLYIMKINSSGTIEGGEIILDALPLSVTHGENGDSTNEVIELVVTTDATSESDYDSTEAIDAVQSLAPDASVVYTGTAPGSLKLLFDITFPAGVDTSVVTTTKTTVESGVSAALAAKPSFASITISDVASGVVSKQVPARVSDVTFTAGASGTAPNATEVMSYPGTYPGTMAGNLWFNMCVDETTGTFYFTTRESTGSMDTQIFKRTPAGVMESIAGVGFGAGWYDTEWLFFYNGDVYMHLGYLNHHRVYKLPNGAGPAEIFFDSNNGGAAFNYMVQFHTGYIYYYTNNAGPLRRKLLSSYTGTTWGLADVAGDDQISCDVSSLGFGTMNGEPQGITTSMKHFRIFENKLYWLARGWGSGNSSKVFRADLDGTNNELMWNLGETYAQNDRDSGNTSGLAPTYRLPDNMWGDDWFKIRSEGFYRLNEHGMDHWPNGSNVRQETIPYKSSYIYDIDGSGTNYNHRWLMVDWIGSTMYIATHEQNGNNSHDMTLLTWPQYGPASILFTTVGPFKTIKHKLSTETTWRSITAGKSGEASTPADLSSFTVDVQLENASDVSIFSGSLPVSV